MTVSSPISHVPLDKIAKVARVIASTHEYMLVFANIREYQYYQIDEWQHLPYRVPSSTGTSSYPCKTQNMKIAGVRSFDFSSLVYWNFRWIVLKSYILQRYKRLISGIQRTEYSLSVQPLMSAIIFRFLETWFQHRGHFENDYLLEASSFLRRQQQSLAKT